MITVVTITYNNFDELVSTLKSLEDALSPGQVESLVINGGSCEKTKKFLATYTGKSITQKDNGISDAFNKGILNAQGDYIAVLNSGDTLLNKSYYINSLEHFKAFPHDDYIYGNAIFSHRNFGDMIIKPEVEAILLKMPFCHCSMVIRKSVFKLCGLYDTNLKIAMDYDLLIRMYKKKLSNYYLDTSPCILMDGTGISSTNGPAGIKECEAILKRNDLLYCETKKFFFILKLKNRIRNILAFLNLLKSYDQLKLSLYKKNK